MLMNSWCVYCVSMFFKTNCFRWIARYELNFSAILNWKLENRAIYNHNVLWTTNLFDEPSTIWAMHREYERLMFYNSVTIYKDAHLHLMLNVVKLLHRMCIYMKKYSAPIGINGILLMDIALVYVMERKMENICKQTYQQKSN